MVAHRSRLGAMGLLALGMIALFGVFAGAVRLYVSPPASAPPAPSDAGWAAHAPTVYRALTISLDARGVAVFSPASVSVPAGARVVFTITNFDPSVAGLPTATNAQVAGTAGNTVTIQSGSGTAIVRSLPTDGIAHTFTIASPFAHLNVPIPTAAGGPVRVGFVAVFPSSGTFAFGCVIWCGPMTPDGMSGALTVTPAGA